MAKQSNDTKDENVLVGIMLFVCFLMVAFLLEEEKARKLRGEAMRNLGLDQDDDPPNPPSLRLTDGRRN